MINFIDIFVLWIFIELSKAKKKLHKSISNFIGNLPQIVVCFQCVIDFDCHGNVGEDIYCYKWMFFPATAYLFMLFHYRFELQWSRYFWHIFPGYNTLANILFNMRSKYVMLFRRENLDRVYSSLFHDFFPMVFIERSLWKIFFYFQVLR